MRNYSVPEKTGRISTAYITMGQRQKARPVFANKNARIREYFSGPPGERLPVCTVELIVKIKLTVPVREKTVYNSIVRTFEIKSV